MGLIIALGEKKTVLQCKMESDKSERGKFYQQAKTNEKINVRRPRRNGRLVQLEKKSEGENEKEKIKCAKLCGCANY